jgi:GntR family transcriptional regulator, rspAB operon transcriptional repressor
MSSSPGQEPSGDEPLTSLALRRLREEILSGELEPGQRIVQDAVAARYGSSRIPIREALRVLASEGLVTIQPDVGARVTTMDARDLDEVFMLRERLEPLAISESGRHIGPEDLRHARELLAESERHANTADVERYLELDHKFHTFLMSFSERPRLQKMVESLTNSARRYRRSYLLHQPISSYEISVAEHRLILDALERNEPDDAALVSLLHIRRTRNVLNAESAQPRS